MTLEQFFWQRLGNDEKKIPCIQITIQSGREAMTKVQEVYKCEACGNVVEVRKAGEGELVCCGEPMKKQ